MHSLRFVSGDDCSSWSMMENSSHISQWYEIVNHWHLNRLLDRTVPERACVICWLSELVDTSSEEISVTVAMLLSRENGAARADYVQD